MQGDYFLPGKAIATPAELLIDGQQLKLQTESGERFHFLLGETTISPRLGNINRTFRFIDSSLFECRQNEDIDQALYSEQGHSIQSFVHQFESHWGWVGLILLVGGLFAYLLMDRGVPQFSQWAAHQLPPSISDEVGAALFDTLDEGYLTPSKLSNHRQQQLRAEFIRLVSSHQPDHFEHPPQLVFRGGGEIGTNALALPNGVIVVTDEIVELAPNDEALAGVLAHELGHLVHRHGMQMAVTATVVPVFLTLVAGDLVNSSQLASVLPALLLSTGYSRDFEREADRHAKIIFKALGRSTQPVAEFFEAMAILAKEEKSGTSLFSTHPGYADRILFFQE